MRGLTHDVELRAKLGKDGREINPDADQVLFGLFSEKTVSKVQTKWRQEMKMWWNYSLLLWRTRCLWLGHVSSGWILWSVATVSAI